MHYKLRSVILDGSREFRSSDQCLKRPGLEKNVWSLASVFSVILLISAKFNINGFVLLNLIEIIFSDELWFIKYYQKIKNAYFL